MLRGSGLDGESIPMKDGDAHMKNTSVPRRQVAIYGDRFVHGLLELSPDTNSPITRAYFK